MPRPLPVLDLYCHAVHAFSSWFEQRDIQHFWKLTDTQLIDDATVELIYEYEHGTSIDPDMPTACAQLCYHGTKAYNLRAISFDGIAPSDDAELGHDNHGVAGVFVSPYLSVALDDAYSTAQDIFGQGIFYKMYFEVVVDMRKFIHRGRGSWELVFPRSAVWIHKLHIRVNPTVNDHRFQGFEPWLEAVPRGKLPVTTTVRGHGLYDAFW